MARALTLPIRNASRFNLPLAWKARMRNGAQAPCFASSEVQLNYRPALFNAALMACSSRTPDKYRTTVPLRLIRTTVGRD